MILADFHIFWEGLKRPTSIDTALKTLTVNGNIQRENHPDPNPSEAAILSLRFFGSHGSPRIFGSLMFSIHPRNEKCLVVIGKATLYPLVN